MKELDALKARQGLGARWDAEHAPHDALLQARRGTAHFARVLAGLSDAELDYGHRRAIVARIAYQARDMAEALAALRLGCRPEQIDCVRRQMLAECLPHRALRHLFAHTEVHLNVEFRDLPDAVWSDPTPLASGFPCAAKMPLLRAQSVWGGAISLRSAKSEQH